MKYALSVEVKLMQMPDDPEPIEAPRPGDDPMAMIGGLATRVLNAPILHAQPFMGQNAGFDFRKQVEVRVSNFTSLAEIIGRFDNLVADIEAEKLECK